MDTPQLNLLAAVGRQGFMGNEGDLPMFRDKEDADKFRQHLLALCEGSNVIVGGRTYKHLLKAGMQPSLVPFGIFLWNRNVQSAVTPDKALDTLRARGRPMFLIGGRYTFECFMPWVEQMFITRADLTAGAEPLYMPELFGRTQ